MRNRAQEPGWWTLFNSEKRRAVALREVWGQKRDLSIFCTSLCGRAFCSGFLGPNLPVSAGRRVILSWERGTFP